MNGLASDGRVLWQDRGEERWKPMRALILAAALAFFELVSAQAPRRVLFIGNSLTYANSMPAMVEGIARSIGEAIHCETVAFSDYSLEDHWKQGDAVRAI